MKTTRHRLTENGLTKAQEAEILRIADETRRGINTVGPMGIGEAIQYLKRLAVPVRKKRTPASSTTTTKAEPRA